LSVPKGENPVSETSGKVASQGNEGLNPVLSTGQAIELRLIRI